MVAKSHRLDQPLLHSETLLNSKTSGFLFKRTVARSTRVRQTRQKNTPRIRRAFVEINKRAANAGSVHLLLLSALSAIATPSASTLQNLCTFLGRVPALGAAMAESAVKKKIKKLCDNAC